MSLFCNVDGCITVFSKGVKSYSIPKVRKTANLEMKRKMTAQRNSWLKALRLKNAQNIGQIRVCYAHFITGSPAKCTDTKNPDWSPTLSMGYHTSWICNDDYEKQSTDKIKKLPRAKGKRRSRRSLKQKATINAIKKLKKQKAKRKLKNTSTKKLAKKHNPAKQASAKGKGKNRRNLKKQDNINLKKGDVIKQSRTKLQTTVSQTTKNSVKDTVEKCIPSEQVPAKGNGKTRRSLKQQNNISPEKKEEKIDDSVKVTKRNASPVATELSSSKKTKVVDLSKLFVRPSPYPVCSLCEEYAVHSYSLIKCKFCFGPTHIHCMRVAEPHQYLTLDKSSWFCKKCINK